MRSHKFDFFQATGDPVTQVIRFTQWKADELIYLDISRDDIYDTGDTMQVIGSETSRKNSTASRAKSFTEVIAAVAKACFIPLTVGGKIRSLEDIRRNLRNGADKISINTKALEDPAFITQAAEAFGSQCIVVSVDVRANDRGVREVYSGFGEMPTGWDPVAWCREAERRGAGEILLNSIDRDGTGTGYDVDLVHDVSQGVSIPVVALGGVGKYEHFTAGLGAGASAIAAANIFHFTEQSIINAKHYLGGAGVPVRL